MHALLIGLAVVGLAVWYSAADLTTWTPNGSREPLPSGSLWTDWHPRGWFGPGEQILLGFMTGLPLLALLGAWVFLPTVHRAGSVWRSFWRAYRAVVSSGGVVLALTLLVGSTIVAAVIHNSSGDSDVQGFFLFLLTVSGLCTLAVWLMRAVRAVVDETYVVELPPRCEGCGYDLTHRPTDERCPECGLDVNASLTPEVRRPGCRWQNDPQRVYESWLTTSTRVLFHPRAFYDTLKMKDGQTPVGAFARRHYLMLGPCAMAWMLGSMTLLAGVADSDAVCAVPLAMLFLIPLIGWALHRVIGAIAASIAVTFKEAPDGRWTERIIDYEVVFLWVFSLFNAAYIDSLFLFHDWMTQLARHLGFGRFLLGLPVELLFVVFGNATLCVIWLWRYRVAARHTRYANF